MSRLSVHRVTNASAYPVHFRGKQGLNFPGWNAGVAGWRSPAWQSCH